MLGNPLAGSVPGGLSAPSQMPGLANGLPQMGARPMPGMAYGGFAGGGLSDPAALLARGQLSQAMHGAPYSIAAGLVNSLVAGRTDQLPVDVPHGSYVLPADVVSGLGQGNTMAGAKLLEQIFTKDPGNVAALGLASGGAAPGQKVPIIVAGGEVLVAPHQVEEMGRRIVGAKATPEQAMDAGHKALDRMVVKVRAQVIAHQKKLPGPKK